MQKIKNGRFYPSSKPVEKHSNNGRTLHTNSVFSPFVGDGALDVPLVSDFFNKLKGRFYPSSKFFQTHYRSYSVMRFKSFILIHIFICDVHNVVKPEIFYRSNGCAHAY